MTIKGDSGIAKVNGIVIGRATVKIDSTKTPNTVDSTATDGLLKGMTTLAILQIKDDELLLCEAEPGKERPTEFAAKEGSGHHLQIFKRVKGAEQKAGGQLDKEWQGNWQVVSAVKDGKQVPLQPDQPITLTHKENNVTIKYGGAKVAECVVKMDTTMTPKKADVTVVDGQGKGSTTLGIYEIKGDELRLCHSEPGQERPTEFTAKLGSGRSLFICKRLKP